MMDNESKILKAIMERYAGLTILHTAMSEDENCVLINLSDDLNDEISEKEILKYIHKILG